MEQGGEDTKEGRDGVRNGLRRKQRIAAALTLGVLVATVGIAWLLEASARRSDGSAPYTVRVEQAGETIGVLELEDLRSLEQQSVVALGRRQEGPALLTVLATCGVDEFEHVEVFGMGYRDSGYIKLSVEEIDEDMLLDFNNRGTTKLVSPEMAWTKRVRDVERIVVK